MVDEAQRRKLRRDLREKRKALSPSEQQQAAKKVCEQVLTLPEIASASCIAAYLANDGEVSLVNLIHGCWDRLLTTSLPVIHPFSKKSLLFLRYHQHSSLGLNRFSIPEPALRCPDVIPLQRHSVILMPLVGFDKKGNRLGMGGGFYDRTLAAHRDTPGSPTLIGIAHDCQEVPSLPIAPWDIPLNAIITPRRTLRFRNN